MVDDKEFVEEDTVVADVVNSQAVESSPPLEDSRPDEVPPFSPDDSVILETSVDESVAAISDAPVEEVDPEVAEALAKAHLPWYVVHTYSGFEARVKLTLEERIRTAGVQDKFGRIIVPQEKVVELVKGEKKTSSRKFFPGYMLIQCELNDDTWHLVKDTPKVTGFVGDSHNPMPLSAQEVQNLFEQMEGGAQKARPKVQFEDGDSVKVIDGPFADFNGTVDEVKPDKGKLRVLISIFGRNTPVELDFIQVEKV
jgi:transcriptional antiterminator NusG